MPIIHKLQLRTVHLSLQRPSQCLSTTGGFWHHHSRSRVRRRGDFMSRAKNCDCLLTSRRGPPRYCDMRSVKFGAERYCFWPKFWQLLLGYAVHSGLLTSNHFLFRFNGELHGQPFAWQFGLSIGRGQLRQFSQFNLYRPARHAALQQPIQRYPDENLACIWYQQ